MLVDLDTVIMTENTLTNTSSDNQMVKEKTTSNTSKNIHKNKDFYYGYLHCNECNEHGYYVCVIGNIFKHYDTVRKYYEQHLPIALNKVKSSLTIDEVIQRGINNGCLDVIKIQINMIDIIYSHTFNFSDDLLESFLIGIKYKPITVGFLTNNVVARYNNQDTNEDTVSYLHYNRGMYFIRLNSNGKKYSPYDDVRYFIRDTYILYTLIRQYYEVEYSKHPKIHNLLSLQDILYSNKIINEYMYSYDDGDIRLPIPNIKYLIIKYLNLGNEEDIPLVYFKIPKNMVIPFSIKNN